MLTDYSYCNQPFVDGLKAFLDYTTPNSPHVQEKEGLIVRRRFMQKQDFEKRCIQRWAISELINSITNNPQDPIEETTYKLALKMFYFANAATNMSVKRVFCIAGDFIEKEVINLFRAREGVYP